MARRRNGAAALEDTQALLADTNRQIEDVRARRADELRAAADEKTLDKFDAEIERLETLAGRHRERVALLEAEAAEAEAQRRVREKEDLIRRIEKKAGDERRAAAIEIRDGIAKADAGLRKLVNIGRNVQAAWPWQAHDLAPCLFTPPAILAAITHELHRIGARPMLLGGQDKFGAGINFPGGKAPRIELAGVPDRITPLVDVIAEASALASRIMRDGKSSADADPVIADITVTTPAPADAVSSPNSTEGAPRERTAAEVELEKLLNKQIALSEDLSPEGEAAYAAVVAEIARVSTTVEAERIGAQNGR